jgi:DnaB-like helicase N terminal domain
VSASKVFQSNVTAPPLPSSIEAERSILGSVLLDNVVLAVAKEKLQVEDFFLREHRVIFQAMGKLATNVDAVTLMEELNNAKQLEAAGGIVYLSSLPNGLPRTANIGNYIEIVKKKAAQRRLIFLGKKFQEAGFASVVSVEDLRSEAADVFDDFSQDAHQTTAETLQVADMHETVLEGRLGEFCRRHLGDLPLAYSYLSLLTIAGTFVPVSEVRTNLYCALVGPVGSAKTQAIERAILTMGLSKPLLENTLAGSFEGLAVRLNVSGDARLLSPDELGHLLLKAQIDGASFPFVLNRAFGGSEFDVLAARGKQIQVNCRLGIIGGIVEEKFSELFNAATTGGLYDRFIFGRCPQPFQYQYRPFKGRAECTQPCPVAIAGDVWELRDLWLKEIVGLSARIAELTIRAAVIAAAFSGRSILYARDIEASGRAFAEYQVRMRHAFKPNPGENTDARCAFAVRTTLGEKPGWNLKRDIAKKIHYERFGPTAFERAINSLVASGDIHLDARRPARIRRVD